MRSSRVAGKPQLIPSDMLLPVKSQNTTRIAYDDDNVETTYKHTLTHTHRHNTHSPTPFRTILLTSCLANTAFPTMPYIPRAPSSRPTHNTVCHHTYTTRSRTTHIVGIDAESWPLTLYRARETLTHTHSCIEWRQPFGVKRIQTHTRARKRVLRIYSLSLFFPPHAHTHTYTQRHRHMSTCERHNENSQCADDTHCAPNERNNVFICRQMHSFMCVWRRCTFVLNKTPPSDSIDSGEWRFCWKKILKNMILDTRKLQIGSFLSRSVVYLLFWIIK